MSGRSSEVVRPRRRVAAGQPPPSTLTEPGWPGGRSAPPQQPGAAPVRAPSPPAPPRVRPPRASVPVPGRSVPVPRALGRVMRRTAAVADPASPQPVDSRTARERWRSMTRNRPVPRADWNGRPPPRERTAPQEPPRPAGTAPPGSPSASSAPAASAPRSPPSLQLAGHRPVAVVRRLRRLRAPGRRTAARRPAGRRPPRSWPAPTWSC